MIARTTVKKTTTKQHIRLRTPLVQDASQIHRLVRESHVLDTNSCYAYLLLCEHFSRTCIVAQRGAEVVGFVTGYIPPEKPDVVFVWQVAVDRSARKQGLAKRMLRALLNLPRCRGARFLETTVSPSNLASRRLFQSLAEELGTELNCLRGFEQSDFEYEQHEDEELLRIGPF